VTIVAEANIDPNDKEFQQFKAVIGKDGNGLGTDANVESGYQGAHHLEEHCSTAGFVAEAAADGTLSNFTTLDATGIYKLG
jgi:hypothetical protein